MICTRQEVMQISLRGLSEKLRSTSRHVVFSAFEHWRGLISLLGSPKNLRFWDSHPYRKRPYFATAAFSHNTTRSDFIEGLGLLTAARVRYIRFPLSWRLRALIMGLGKTARKPRQYRLIRAKRPVNQWFGYLQDRPRQAREVESGNVMTIHKGGDPYERGT